MRMRKKKNLIPRMERCAACRVRDGFALKGRWREELMPSARELRVEVGCGKGRFTVETARQEPDVLFVAVERVADALVVAMERATALELKNVFFVVGDAALLPDYFAEDEVDRIYINFCDPWPSTGRAKRRLTHRGFLETYRRVLKMGGQVHFKTDNRPLFTFSVLEFPAAGYELSEVTQDLHRNGPQGVMTDYEAKFHAQGVPINRCVGTKTEWTPPETEDTDAFQMEPVQLVSREQYHALLQKLEPEAAFIVLTQIDRRDPEAEVIRRAGDCMELLERKPVWNWLGTVRLGDPAEQYTFAASRSFFIYLRKFESFFLNEPNDLRITDFGYDDIAFLDRDRQPLFYTTTHEGYAYLRRGL